MAVEDFIYRVQALARQILEVNLDLVAQNGSMELQKIGTGGSTKVVMWFVGTSCANHYGSIQR